VALEADFVGTHIGEFQGVPATGNAVRVPYAVVYDVDGGRIVALRVYLPMHALMAQITTSRVSAQA
jgi:predicted ester cyclase